LVTGTDPHNNMAERVIRLNVIIQKITNGHRSESGASHKVLMSIKETCRVQGLNFHDYSLEYFSNVISKGRQLLFYHVLFIGMTKHSKIILFSFEQFEKVIKNENRLRPSFV